MTTAFSRKLLAREQWRTISQSSFYLLFLCAPLLEIFRFDIIEGHFIIFGHPWMFGLEYSEFECIDTSHSVSIVLLNFLLPIVLVILFAGVFSWKYGRIYCGWLCPHFSVVETINRLMLKYLNRVTLWEKSAKETQTGSARLLIFVLCLMIAFIWSYALLSYIYPPKLLTTNLIHFELSFGPTLFLVVMTLVLTLDFFFARHLFCKFACSVGILQSFAWMANRRSMVIAFDQSRANLCQSCDNECDKSCPMRLPVRGIKRAKITCTQCGVCLTACDKEQKNNPDGRLIHWVTGDKAIAVDRIAPAFAIKRLKKST